MITDITVDSTGRSMNFWNMDSLFFWVYGYYSLMGSMIWPSLNLETPSVTMVVPGSMPWATMNSVWVWAIMSMDRGVAACPSSIKIILVPCRSMVAACGITQTSV